MEYRSEDWRKSEMQLENRFEEWRKRGKQVEENHKEVLRLLDELLEKTKQLSRGRSHTRRSGKRFEEKETNENLNRFQPEALDDPYKAIFSFKFKQSGTMAEFRREFKKMIRALRFEDEELLKEAWLNGIKSSIREELMMHPAITLLEMIKFSLKIEKKNVARKEEGLNAGGRNGLRNGSSGLTKGGQAQRYNASPYERRTWGFNGTGSVNQTISGRVNTPPNSINSKVSSSQNVRATNEEEN